MSYGFVPILSFSYTILHPALFSLVLMSGNVTLYPDLLIE